MLYAVFGKPDETKKGAVPGQPPFVVNDGKAFVMPKPDAPPITSNVFDSMFGG